MRTDLTSAATQLAEVMSTAGASLSHLACSEADAIALLLRAAGHRAAAIGVIVNHASPDESREHGDQDRTDLHHCIYTIAVLSRDPSQSPQVRRLAENYLNGLTGTPGAAKEIIVGRDEERLTLSSGTGNRIELKYKLGPNDQVELEASSVSGQTAIWVETDLVSGGEEDDGYPPRD